MSTTLESASATLKSAQVRYNEALDNVEARLAALPPNATTADVDAIERSLNIEQLKNDLDSATKRFDSTQAITEARKANPIRFAGELQVTESTTYDRKNPHASFFGDLYALQRNQDRTALERLERGSKETLVQAEERKLIYRDAEGRALNSTTTSGGEFLPPIYFGDLYAEFRRAKRVTASLFRNLPLVAYGNSITVPRITGGSTAAAQVGDNQNLSNTDPVTAMLTVPVCTVAGYVDISRQAAERSEPGLDQILMEDLLSSYGKQVNNYCLNGSGSSGQPLGLVGTSGVISVSYNDTTPTVAELYPKILDAARQVQENVFAPATAIVMTARRWAWILSAVDSSGRPLVVPNGNGPYNEIGVVNSGNTFGNDGNSISAAGTLLGLPVYIDETISKVTGGTTNQDSIFVAAFNENILWEDEAGPRKFVFDAILSQTAGLRVQVFGYAAATSGRFPAANAIVSGSGLQAPTF